MKLALLSLGAVAFLLLLIFLCMRQLHFRIGCRHLKVMLFGIAIRKIALTDIAYVSKREPKGAAERWLSTWKLSHRLLVVERKTGLRKYFCITPQNRYVFLADLKAAVRRVDPTAEWAALRAFEDTTHLYKKPGSTPAPEELPRDRSSGVIAS